MLFAKGKSGNPGGRPKSLGKLLRKQYGEDGKALIARLEAFSHPPKGKRVARKLMLDATKVLLEYHSGRPAQTMLVEVDEPQVLRVVIDDERAAPPRAG